MTRPAELVVGEIVARRTLVLDASRKRTPVALGELSVSRGESCVPAHFVLDLIHWLVGSPVRVENRC